MAKPLNRLHITITGEQGHGKTLALQAIADALGQLGFQVWSRDDGDIPYVFRRAGNDKGPLFLGSARIETKYPDE